MACAVMRRTRSHVSIRARTRGHSGIRAESRCAACVLRCFGAQGAARWPGALALRRMTERFGGGRGIRTPGTVSGSVVFKTTAIDHSAIPPRRNCAWRVLSESARQPPTCHRKCHDRDDAGRLGHRNRDHCSLLTLRPYRAAAKIRCEADARRNRRGTSCSLTGGKFIRFRFGGCLASSHLEGCVTGVAAAVNGLPASRPCRTPL
jgi:hypothetical protein